MKQHPLLKSETFWFCFSMILTALIMFLVFGEKIFSDRAEMNWGKNGVVIPMAFLYVLLPLFIVFIVFCIKDQFPASSTTHGRLMIRFTGLAYIGIAGALNLILMILAFNSFYTPSQGFFSQLSNNPISAVVGVLFLSVILVLVLLLFTVYKNRRSLA